MNCREARHAMSMHLGHDGLDPAEWEQARRHAGECSQCRDHFQHLKACLADLRNADAPLTYDEHHSIWPAVRAQLSQGTVGRDRGLDSRTLSALGVFAAACLMFCVVQWTRPDVVDGDLSGGVWNERQAVSPFPDLLAPTPHLSREAREADERARRSHPEPADSSPLRHASESR